MIGLLLKFCCFSIYLCGNGIYWHVFCHVSHHWLTFNQAATCKLSSFTLFQTHYCVLLFEGAFNKRLLPKKLRKNRTKNLIHYMISILPFKEYVTNNFKTILVIMSIKFYLFCLSIYICIYMHIHI